jgi:hypothetical protein
VYAAKMFVVEESEEEVSGKRVKTMAQYILRVL